MFVTCGSAPKSMSRDHPGEESRSSFVPEEPDELDDIADMWRWATVH